MRKSGGLTGNISLEGPNRTYHTENTIAVKHGVRIMLWKCFSSAGIGKQAVIEGNMVSANHGAFLEENLLQSTRDLRWLRCSFSNRAITLRLLV